MKTHYGDIKDLDRYLKYDFFRLFEQKVVLLKIVGGLLMALPEQCAGRQ